MNFTAVARNQRGDVIAKRIADGIDSRSMDMYVAITEGKRREEALPFFLCRTGKSWSRPTDRRTTQRVKAPCTL